MEIAFFGADGQGRLVWRALALGETRPATLSATRLGVITEDLGDWASALTATWTLWWETSPGDYVRVRFDEESVLEGITPVQAGQERAFLDPTGPESFTLKTGASAVAPVRVATRRLTYGNRVHWTGRLRIPHRGATQLRGIVVERTSGVEHPLTIDVRRHGSSSGPVVTADVDFSLAWGDITPAHISDWLDPYLVVSQEGLDDIRVGIPRPRFMRRLVNRVRSAQVSAGDTVRYIGPFYTFKGRRLAAHVSSVPADTARAIRETKRGLALRRWIARRTRRPLWVIGETGYKAQDTGLHFFRYLMDHHPHIDARFVIDADSPDLAEAEAVGPVLLHGSPEHARAVLLADRIIGSHHPEYLFPVRTNDFKRAVRAPRVFLQHGVMGTKWMAGLYGFGRGGFETDMFLVSSPSEKRMIERDFGYPPDRVVVTGLSRFDALLAPSTPERQILIIPTWRDWITDQASFHSSEFLENWLAFVRSPAVRDLVSSGNWRIRFILHPNFRHFAGVLEDAGVEVIRQGDWSVQALMRQSAVLVTDYSSVGFDFALLRRPVIYFQFDRSRFLGPQGSHLDLDAVLPGSVAFTAKEAALQLTSVVEGGCGVDDATFERATAFFPAMNRESCARVYSAVQATRPTRSRAWKSRVATVGSAAFRKFRRSRFYFPVAKALFRLWRRLPLRSNWVVVESGLGQRLGDSPLAIADALKEMRPDLRVIWSATDAVIRQHGLVDAVPRLSLRYFYALARAQYWVNNQSFPHYVRRRGSQTFVQTWHGTPLKRMALDLDEVHGRDDGYLTRATTGARQWSVLTSPNAYTTAIMRSAFGFEGKALELGYPRNDVLHGQRRDAAAERARSVVGIEPGQRVVLFAPTFRDRSLSGAPEEAPTAALGLTAWLNEFDDDTTLLLRRHVLDKSAAQIPEHTGSRVIDVTSYPDMQDLLALADVLVTDYSSVYFDYLNTRRPIVFFAPDLADYRDVLRGFYLDYATDLPGPVAEEPARARALIREALGAGRFEGYDLDRFAAMYCPHDDGHAAQRIVTEVFGAGRQD
ncbi:CDP-glycerol glycerophosphotransferase family protein [Demequina sp.]|uniref:CDP-glycerol glycerophosphotransferase family protein n=1 Tax=Demequina sp. TaxID=2050685 RepID=UPI003A871BEB